MIATLQSSKRGRVSGPKMGRLVHLRWGSVGVVRVSFDGAMRDDAGGGSGSGRLRVWGWPMLRAEMVE